MVKSSPYPVLSILSNSRGFVKRASKRRRTIVDEDNDDWEDHKTFNDTNSTMQSDTFADEEAEAGCTRSPDAKMPTEMDGEEVSAAEEQEEQEETEQPADRLVLLSIKTSASRTVNFALKASIVRMIPEYAHMLDKVAACTAGRLRIVDKTIRKEEVVIQMIEYLSAGTLEPLDTGNTPKRALEILFDLIGLYDASVHLCIPELESAIVEHISSNIYSSDESTFVQFAMECYKAGKDAHKVISHQLQ